MDLIFTHGRALLPLLLAVPTDTQEPSTRLATCAVVNTIRVTSVSATAGV